MPSAYPTPDSPAPPPVLVPPAKHRLTRAEIERAIAMRETGRSVSAIAGTIGCSEKALSWHFLKEAVDPPKPPALRLDYHLRCPAVRRGGHVVRAFTPEEDARLVAMDAQGLGMSAIGRALGRKSNSVRGRLMTLARREERALNAGGRAP